SWSEPRQGNNLSAVRLRETTAPDGAAMGVAVEGSQTAVTNGEISLPQFDSFNRQLHWFEIFNKGKTQFKFSAEASEWIRIGNPMPDGPLWVNGIGFEIQKDQRMWIDIDWSKVPAGTNSGTIKIAGT